MEDLEFPFPFPLTRLSRILTRRERDGLQDAVFEWEDSHGTRGKHPESFGQGGKTIPKRAQDPFDAYQGAICPVANPFSSCGQADSSCGQPLFLLWPALRIGVNTWMC